MTRSPSRDPVMVTERPHRLLGEERKHLVRIDGEDRGGMLSLA
jgi:hypothetical protein